MSSADLLTIVALIAPGLLAVEVRNFFAPLRRRSGLEQTAEAVLYSLLAYTISVQASWTRHSPLADLLAANKSMTILAEPSVVGLLFTVFVTATWLGAVVGKALSTETAATIAAQLAHRTVIDSVWQELFHALTKRPGQITLECELASGIRVRGKLDTVGVEPADRDCVLSSPEIISPSEMVGEEALAILLPGDQIRTITIVGAEPRPSRGPIVYMFLTALVGWPLAIAVSRLLA